MVVSYHHYAKDVILLKKLRTRFNRFCLKHRNKGIPNLMLYIIIGSAIVTGLSYLGFPQIYNLLCFNRNAILKGQVWRLFSYVFTMNSSSLFFTLIMLYCTYSLGRALEMTWGTLRFNLYYFSGILLMDIFAMAFGWIPIYGLDSSIYFYAGNMMSSLHLSLLLCYATSYPDARFTLFFIIPIRAWILAMIYLIITAFSVVSMSLARCFPHNLFPLIGLMNYFILCGGDMVNVLPPAWRMGILRRQQKKSAPKPTGSVPFTRNDGKKVSVPYTHRCTVCGRNDATNPELEFRYCSRCNGYFCYCEDHISNHTHVE